MAITAQVTFDELSGPERTRSFVEDQNAKLLELEDKYRALLAEALPPEKRDDALDSRHFWFNGRFQPHKGRYLADIASTPAIKLDFRPDRYVVSTPRHAEMERKIDPEKTGSEVMRWLKEKNMIGDVCCYEMVNAKDSALIDLEKSLWEQNLVPYTDPAKKENSHLRVRVKKALQRQAVLVLVVCGLIGLVAGWGLHRLM